MRSEQQEGAVLWFTGLSGAGKSTLAEATREALGALGRRVEVLDGDAVREFLSKGLTFSRADRDLNVMRIAFVANLLARNGVIAITAAISPYRDTRAQARALCGERFIEAYVSAPLATCEARDVKGLYKRARAGEIQQFTGITDPYEPPEVCELTVATHTLSLDQSVAHVLSTLRSRGVL
ncbi:MAG: adenylyl-sulfate kinase [Deltaproteobacteria bacterium]|nr:adenylyl-sulfate kinase [Deltaproteobacteria bacterium]